MGDLSYSPSTGPLAPACTEYDVRLAEGNNGYMGIVEACYTPPGANSSLWGPICVTSFNYWTVIHAKTICTQLGLPSKGITLWCTFIKLVRECLRSFRCSCHIV